MRNGEYGEALLICKVFIELIYPIKFMKHKFVYPLRSIKIHLHHEVSKFVKNL